MREIKMNRPENLKTVFIAVSLFKHLEDDVINIEKTIGELDDTTKKVMFSLLRTNIKALIEVTEEFDKKGEIY